MYELFAQEITLQKGKCYDPYLMWMYGYLVKHWVAYNNTSPKDIWKILPIDKYEFAFSFCHTQGWDYIIEDATKRYKEKVKD